ncbi:MAG: glycosyltransferase [Chitinophagaceae bacterium]
MPVRNEAAHIGRLIESLQAQQYPAHLLEIIIVNDDSTDETVQIVEGYDNVKLIHLKADAINSYKKKAVDTGIQASAGELIITTDGDCHMGPEWLATMVAFYEKNNYVYIAAPVAMQYSNRLLSVFQAYDFAVLQGITAAAVHRQLYSMSNGANQAYSRTAFDAVGGFTGIDHIASGDDLLLMHKIAWHFPGRTGYVLAAEAIVHTETEHSWTAFLQQRIRWASKAGHYMDFRIKAVMLLVFLFNLCFPVLLIAGCWHTQWWLLALGLWVGKTLAELPFVVSISRFFGMQGLLKYFFFLQPLHILYTLTAGLLGQQGKYQWKGRMVR